jgi:TRAP-type C4-dicarboxylate transport system permease small subunit
VKDPPVPHTFPLLRKHRTVPRILLIIEEYIPGALLGLTAVMLTADVVMRYVFNRPIQGVAEVAMLATVWLVYLSASGISRRGGHIALDLFTGRFGARGRAIFDIFAELVTIAVLSVILVTAIDYLSSGHFVTLPATGISKAFITVAIPISAGMMIVHSAIFLLRAVIGLGDPGYHRHHEAIETEEIEDPATRDIRRIDSDLTGERGEK